MSKHTPGPWEIKRSFDPAHRFICAPEHLGLAQVVWCMEDEDRSPECEANAHLIAAAPELLEMLTLARDRIESVRRSGEFDPLIRDIDDAIAKATGVLAEGGSEDS